MSRRDHGPELLAHVLREAVHEDGRADHAAAVAARYETSSSDNETVRRLRQMMAAVHLQTEKRHRTAAELYRAYAARLGRRSERAAASPPTSLMAVLRAVSGAESMSVSLLAGEAGDVLLASDAVSQKAQNLEFTLGEGPAHDCLMDGPLSVADAQILRRWPSYGPAIVDLGIGALIGAPLRRHSAVVGSIVAYRSRRSAGSQPDLARLGHVGEAFVDILLGDPGSRLVMDEIDYRPVVHQAAGMLAVQLGCSVSDALAMLRARAFASGEDVTVVAERVVSGTDSVVPG